MGLLLDEVFGAEHRVALIPYATQRWLISEYAMPSVTDFLLWYARDKDLVKYRQLYEPLDRIGKIEYMSSYAMVELADGATRGLSAEERIDPDAHLPDGARVYRRMPLTSASRRQQLGDLSPIDGMGRIGRAHLARQWQRVHRMAWSV